MLIAHRISVSLGRAAILNDVTFAAHPGQVSAIVGPNGSGKTTLLRAMTGDLAHTGSVTLNGRDLSRLRPWEAAELRAVLPQASALAFPFTALEVVQIGLHRGSAGADDDIAMQALSRVGLAHHAGRYFQQLSGGEQQRVQLARVLAQVWQPVRDGEPRWLFLDEPVSALDIAHQIQVMRIARDFTGAGGGVVAVMHDLNLTAIFADSVTILSGGTVLSTGTPAQVMTDETLSRAYGCRLRVGQLPATGTPFILPHSADAHAGCPQP